jgi:hypothetical protein
MPVSSYSAIQDGVASNSFRREYLCLKVLLQNVLPGKVVSFKLVIWFGVDVTKGRRDAVRWAAEQLRHRH